MRNAVIHIVDILYECLPFDEISLLVFCWFWPCWHTGEIFSLVEEFEEDVQSILLFNMKYCLSDFILISFQFQLPFWPIPFQFEIQSPLLIFKAVSQSFNLSIKSPLIFFLQFEKSKIRSECQKLWEIGFDSFSKPEHLSS